MSDKRSFYLAALTASAAVALSDETREACKTAATLLADTTTGEAGRAITMPACNAVRAEVKGGVDPESVIGESIARIAAEVARTSSSERCAKLCAVLDRYMTALQAL